MAISAAFSIWAFVPPSAAQRPAAAIGRGDADLALAADLGARDRGVELEEAADRGRGQQEIGEALPRVAPSQWSR